MSVKSASVDALTLPAFFNQIFGSSPTAIAISRLPDGAFVVANNAFLSMHEYSREEVLEHTSDELFLWSNSKDREKILALIKAEGHAHNFPHEYRTKSGRLGRALASVTIIEIGGTPYLIGFLTDISELNEDQLAFLNSANKYEGLFNNMRNGFAYCRMLFDHGKAQDFVYLSVNESFEKQTGLKNVVGKKVSEVIPGILQSNPTLIELYGQVATSGKSNQFETYVAELKIWLLISVYSPEREYFIALFDNITKHKEDLKALAESEDRFRSMFENILHGVVFQNEHGEISLANQKALDILGLTIDQMQGRTSIDPRWKSIHEDGSDFPGDTHPAIAALRSGKPVENVVMGIFNPKINQTRWINISAVPLGGTGGSKPDKVFTTFLDITEQRKSDLELLKFRNIIESSEDAIISKSLTGIIESWNEGAAKLFGYTSQEVIGKTMQMLIPPERQNEEAVILDRISRGQKIDHFETVRQHKNGRLIYISSTISPILDDKGKVVGVSKIARDITARKKSEAEMAQVSFAINHVNEAAYMMDYKGCFIFVNDAAVNALVYTREEFLGGMRFQDIGPGWTDEIWNEHWQDIKTNGSRTIEAAHQAKDGHIFPIEVSANFLEYEGQYYIMSLVRDITERKELYEDIQRHKLIVETAREGFWRTDKNGFVREANQSYASMTGYTIAELCGMHISQLDAHDKPEDVKNRLKEIYAKGSMSFETQHKHKDGHLIDIEISTTVLRDTDEFVVFCRDISDRKRAEQSLQVTASVFGISQEAIIITDTNNNIVDVNLAFTRVTGYSREEVVGKNPSILSSGLQGMEFYIQMWNDLKRDKSWRGEIWNRRKSGEIYPEMLSISALCDNDDNVLRHVAVFSDISQLKEHEAELTRVAHYDPLTSIPNRLLLADRMKQGISQTARDRNMMAICYLDLDGFKPINDMMGHESGDAILIEVSRRIEHTIRGGDTVARLGGDEFVILLLGLEKGEECLTTLERLLKSIAEPIIVQNKTLKISASIGVSIYPTDNEDPDTLMRHADQAMYVAKESGKNRYHIYDVAMDKRSKEQNEFLHSIRLALEQNQFELHYQPKINLHTKELAGVEALIRWRHPEHGILPPSEFLRQIENTGLDIDIGEWVTNAALEQMYQWKKVGLDVEVSINISGYHLESSGFIEKLKQLLSRYPDLPSSRLQIEVLETVALNDINAVREIIGACGKLGVTFAIDDFGTGYSSLGYLNALPVDAIKIDQTFVRDMLEDDGDKAIVIGVIALAKAFGRQTVAEGIETRAHIQVLAGMGCELGQGYGIARPMPAGEIIKWKLK